jgi:hypothetical protein
MGNIAGGVGGLSTLILKGIGVFQLIDLEL